jgi:toxin ParE1/3/4
MPRIERTAQAEEDLIELWVYIGHDNVRAADRLLDEIEERFHLLADEPRLGRERPDIAPELRYLPVRGYLILYRPISEGIEIVRVVHGARNIQALMRAED